MLLCCTETVIDRWSVAGILNRWRSSEPSRTAATDTGDDVSLLVSLTRLLRTLQMFRERPVFPLGAPLHAHGFLDTANRFTGLRSHKNRRLCVTHRLCSFILDFAHNRSLTLRPASLKHIARNEP
jgi:hypothetical protein